MIEFNMTTLSMQAIAPNLTILVGELVGARLIAHAGTLINLAKAPASTVQILGAEKALFRALKTKHATPKYGLLFHASLIGQASPKNKGKIARVLAAKCALAIRVDALGDTAEAQIGLDSRAKVCSCSVFLPAWQIEPVSLHMSGNYNCLLDFCTKNMRHSAQHRLHQVYKAIKHNDVVRCVYLL